MRVESSALDFESVVATIPVVTGVQIRMGLVNNLLLATLVSVALSM
jgi:hypothetical protein